MSKRHSASGYKGLARGAVRTVTKRSRYLFYETKVSLDSGGLCYLRGRYDTVGGRVVWSLRNQARGKGSALYVAKSVPINRVTLGLDRLCKVHPFHEVCYVPYLEFRSNKYWETVFLHG